MDRTPRMGTDARPKRSEASILKTWSGPTSNISFGIPETCWSGCPSIAEALKALPEETVVEVKVVALDEAGKP